MTEEKHIFRKNDPIWWDLNKATTPRPPWIPKTRDIQAGWVESIDNSIGVVAISIMTETREMEVYVIKTDQIRKREVL